jgi:para-nitrobenzyl esterase
MQNRFKLTHRGSTRALLLCSVLAIGFGAAASAFAHDDHDDHGDRDRPVVRTVEGPVRGFKEKGVETYLGIPFAAPPVGDLRWRPPAPVKKWKDALDATAFGPTCPQVTTLGPFAGPASTTEDCLYLNVFTTGNGKKKPVIVWIYGGANSTGETDDYDGSKLATGGPNGVETVVVSMNYRMGLLGFNSNPAINNEGHAWGNYGIMDQQAALRWVQRNVAYFGGDPNNVTLGGQSAGAYDTAANLLAPSSAGLFHRAIMQSYPPNSWLTAAAALTRGTNFGVAAGCPGSGAAAAACLRKLTPARILQLQGTPNGNGPYTQQVFVDGTFIPMQPDAAWAAGAFHKMPIMTGNTKDDGNFGIGIAEYFSGPPQVPQTEAQYLATVPEAARALYPLSAYNNSPSLANSAYGSDRQSCRTLHVVQTIGPQVPTYAYIFDYRNAPYHFPKMPGWIPGATHTIDIQFLFPNYHGGNLGVNIDQDTGMPRELNAAERKLSDHLVAAWTNFAKTGNPNGSGTYPWARSSSSTAVFYSQNLPTTQMVSQAQFVADHKCDYWYPTFGY